MENASRPGVEFYGVEILLLLSREISSVRARLVAAQNSAKIWHCISLIVFVRSGKFYLCLPVKFHLRPKE